MGPALFRVAVESTHARDPISLEAVLYSCRQGGATGTKWTIVPVDITYAEKGRVATALVAK